MLEHATPTAIRTDAGRDDLCDALRIEGGLIALVDVLERDVHVGGFVHLALYLEQHEVHLILPLLVAGQIDLLGLAQLLAALLEDGRINGEYVREAEKKQLIRHVPHACNERQQLLPSSMPARPAWGQLCLISI